LPGGIRSEQQTNEQRREVGVVGVASLTIGKTVEEAGELGRDFRVQGCQTPAQLRSTQRCHPDLGEQDAAVAIGRELDEQEVETAGEGALGIEHVQLGAERGAQILDDLLDGRDQ
jgi:hypothetical protein